MTSQFRRKRFAAFLMRSVAPIVLGILIALIVVFLMRLGTLGEGGF